MNSPTFSIKFNTLSPISGSEVIVQKATVFDLSDMHTHDFIEIAFVQSGCGWHVLGEAITRCESGSIYIIDFDEAHMFMAENDSVLIVYNLIFCPGFFGVFPFEDQNFSNIVHNFLLRTFRYSDLTHSISAKFTSEEVTVITSLFDRMIAEYLTHKPGFEELIRSWTVELLVYIFRKLCAEEKLSTPLPQLKEEAFQCVFDYIQQHYAEAISLEKLATLIFVSPKYFTRLFKTYAGCTVSEYTQKIRIGHACEMLKTSSLPITEIAERTGYHDVKYFHTVFFRLMGVTPAEYRRRVIP